MSSPIHETISTTHWKGERKRLTIGYITQHAYHGIGLSLLTGIYDAARDFDINLINVVGGSTLREVNLAEITAFKLLNSTNIGGLITWATSLRYYMSINKIEEFHKRYKPLPIVSIAMPMKEIPSVLIDNEMGMKQILGHLIKDHGYRKIAFIKGANGHFYSDERFKAYLRILAEYGIPYDEKLVVSTSEISSSEGVRAIQVLLDEQKLRPGIDFEALASVSDILSIAAMEELKSRGFQAPRDLAVVGFNNREECCISSPPLTTVEVDFYHHGYNAVKILLDLLQGHSVCDLNLSPTKLIIRQSCGCFEPTVTNATTATTATTNDLSVLSDRRTKEGSWQEWADASYSVIISGIRDCLPNFRLALPHRWTEKLVEAFFGYLEGEAVDGFLHIFDNYLILWRNAGLELEAWENVISQLRREVLKLNTEPSLMIRAENALHQARALIFLAQEYSPDRNFFNPENPNILVQLGGVFNSTLNIAELCEIIIKELPKTGIPGCYLSLYEDPSHPEKNARLILAFNQSGRIEPEQAIYPSSQLLPEGLLPEDERYCLFVESCYYKDQLLGFVVFEMGPLNSPLYEILRTNFCSAVCSALIMEERLKVEQEREVLFKALEANNRELEQRNNDIKTVNEQLKAAIDEANRANQAKSTFLTNMSHEMRTPLNCILGFAEVAANLKNPKEIRYYLDLIMGESQKLLELINQLLDLSKIEAGKFKIQNEPFDLLNLMESITSTFAANAKNKGLSFQMELAKDIPQFLNGDALRLRQILVNLIGNAVKFTHEGGINVRAAVKQENAFKVTLYFEIRDTGIGIPADRQRKIFDAFVQAESSTTRKYGGTGLGTSIAKELVHLMGGEIGLVSEEGVGSTFWFTVVMDKIAPDHSLTTSSNLVSVEIPALERRLSILLVEDYPPNQKVVLAYLAGGDFEITIAENGRQALEKFRVQKFDIILMDIQMPEMDGFEATRMIRKEPGGTEVPIIAMTANAFEDDVRKCLESGMNDVVTKPFRKNTLLEKIIYWAANNGRTSSTEVSVTQESDDTMAPIQFQKTLEEFGGDRQLLVSVIDEYIANVREQIPRIAEAIKDQHSETVWREAHSIKGGALNLAAETLAEIAFELEKAGKSGNLTKSPELLSRLGEELVRLEIYIGDQRQGGTGL